MAIFAAQLALLLAACGVLLHSQLLPEKGSSLAIVGNLSLLLIDVLPSFLRFFLPVLGFLAFGPCLLVWQLVYFRQCDTLLFTM